MNKKKIKKKVEKLIDKLVVKKLWKHEISKYNVKERKEIYNQVNLSDSQKREIDKFYLETYGKKIPYTWHRHFTAFTGNFDVKYIPEAIYIAEFEHYMNKGAYKSVVSDKNMISLLAKACNIATPYVYLSNASGVYRDGENRVISEKEAISIIETIQDGFIKPTLDSGSGKNCSPIKVSGGIDEISGLTPEKLLCAYGNDFVIQRKIVCCESIRKIYPDSVNTFRVITYRWNNRIYHMPIIIRIGQGGNYLDNAHAGGMFIAVRDDGRLGECAFTEFKKVYERHPDTMLVFREHSIPEVTLALEKAYILHGAIPQVGVINFDFTIDSNNIPILIEANTNFGSIWLPQMAHGVGGLGENTADILNWLKEKRKDK